MPTEQQNSVESERPRRPTRYNRPRQDPPVKTVFDSGCAAIIRTTDPAAIVALFEGRVGWQAIYNWRAGLRHPPQWAVAILANEIRRLAEAVEATPTGAGLPERRAIARRHLAAINAQRKART